MNPGEQQHFFCMDVLHIKAAKGSGAHCDCGVLLEIWPSGGILQSDEPLAKGERFTVSFDDGQVEAEAQGYEQDEFGYYIKFAVGEPWFPESYHPQYLQMNATHELAKAC